MGVWALFPDVLNLIFAGINFANGYPLTKYAKLNPPRNIRRIRYAPLSLNIQEMRKELLFYPITPHHESLSKDSREVREGVSNPSYFLSSL